MNLLKDAFFGTFSILGLPQNRAVILMYHSVTPGADYFMNVEPVEFEKQMAYLKKKRYPVIALSELVRRITNHEPLGGSVSITFDDGYRDNYTVAFPILKRCGFPATIFVTTDLIGKSDKRNLPRLTIDDMKEMEESGLIDIEPHTMTHPHLSRLDEHAARREILGSKQYLEHVLEKSCQHFAYPYGDLSIEIEKIVRESSHSSCSVREGTNTPFSDPFKMARVSIDRSTSFVQFRGKLSRAVDLYLGAKALLRI